MARTSVRRQNQRNGAALLRDSTLGLPGDREEPEWKERMKQWKATQLAERAITDMSDRSLEQLRNCTFSVLGCL